MTLDLSLQAWADWHQEWSERFVAEDGQTVFPTEHRAWPTHLTVHRNGVALTAGWHIDTPNKALVFDEALRAGDVIDIVYKLYWVADEDWPCE